MRRDVLVAVVFAAVFAALTAGLAAGGALIDLDLAVREWAEAHRPETVEPVPRILNRLGQGGALLGICVALAGWLGLRRLRLSAGWWQVLRPLGYVATAAALVYVLVAVPKAITDRGAPSTERPPEEAVRLLGPQPAGEYAQAYPSGHAVNMIVWYGVLLVLVTALLHAYSRGGLPPVLWWAIRVVPAVLVVGSQTYMSFHWVTDSLAGLSLGLVIDRVLSLLYPQDRLDPGETQVDSPDSRVKFS